MSHSTHLTITHQATALSGYAIAWRKCLAQRPPDPYLDPLWYQLWWDNFGQDATLWLLTPTDATSAYIPLMCREGVMSFVGNVYSHRQGIAGHQNLHSTLEAMLALLETKRDWDGVRLDNLRHDAPEATALREILGPSLGSWREEPGESEAWAIPDIGTKTLSLQQWSDHLHHQGRDARRKRRRVARRAERLANEGTPFALQCHQSPADAKAFAQAYMQILAGSWKAPEQSRTFFRQLCRRTAEQGWFHSYLLTHHNTPVACQLGFLSGRTYFCYKTAYIQQYAACSPGILVMDMAFQDLVEAGQVDRIDLLTGAAPYKDIWCNHYSPQSSFIWGTVPAQKDPLSKPATTTPTTKLRWSHATHQPQPSPKGQVEDVKSCAPLVLALAEGARNLQETEQRLASERWSGLALRHEGQVLDVVWLEAPPQEDKAHILHIAPPFVRAPRTQRLSLIAALLEEQAPTAAIEANAPMAHVGLLKTLGFQEV